jgi:polysaccharide export outer membrane protein
MSLVGALLTAFMLLSTGAASGEDEPAAPASGQKSYVLGPNDRVTVRCQNADEFPASPIRVDSDGQVTLPFVGRVKLAGLTVDGAEKLLTARLSEFIRHPEVALNVTESHSQPVSVFGAVNYPGAYQLEGRKTLTEILAMAGGLRKDSGRVVKLTRRVEWGPIPLRSALPDATGVFSVAEIDTEELVRASAPAVNVEIRPFDVISVPQAELVYVVGQVRKPGGFIMTGRENFTVLQAISMAEGLDRTAAPKKARILRKSASGHIEINVNIESILSGRAQDVPLSAEDVLFIPNNAARSAGMKTLDTIIQLSTGVVIYGRY